MTPTPKRPSSRHGFEIAIICALTIEADAVEALFDNDWDDGGPPFDKVPGDPNAYTNGSIGRHNVVLARMPSMGKVNASSVAAHCRTSYPNIKLALVVGICGAVPFPPSGAAAGVEIVLGDVIVSTGIIQYDLVRQLPEGSIRKETLLDVMGRPNAEIQTLLGKLDGIRGRRKLRGKIMEYLGVLSTESDLAAEYPGVEHDRLFEATYRHRVDSKSCEYCGCDGAQVPRRRLGQDVSPPEPSVHFGLIASGDTVMKSGTHRDDLAKREGIIALEMEGAGVWDSFPCVVIKGACDYADSHKMKAWQKYAAATAAACTKAFLDEWVPSPTAFVGSEQLDKPWFIVPYPKNDQFVGRTAILAELQQRALPSNSQPRVSLFGLGGAGKTQIALAHIYWLQKAHPSTSVFWVHAASVERFKQSYTSIAQECQIPGYDDPKADVLQLVKSWLELKKEGLEWLLVIDNADDLQLFSEHSLATTAEKSDVTNSHESLSRYVPQCAHGAILITTRNKQVGVRLTKGQQPIEIPRMDAEEAKQLLHTKIKDTDGATSANLSVLSSRLEQLPLALAQGAAFIQETSITVDEYIELLDSSDDHLIHLLSKEFDTDGRDSEAPHAVAQTWILSFQLIGRQHALASELLSFMSFFDRQGIPAEFLSYYLTLGFPHDSPQELHEEVRAPQTRHAPRVLRSRRIRRMLDKLRSRPPSQLEDALDHTNAPEQSDVPAQREIELTEALGVLKAFSFVTEERSGSFSMHRLVQLVTRKWLTNSRTLHPFKKAALMTMSELYPYGEYETRTICAAYLPHANAVLQSGASDLKDELRARANLLHCMAAYLDYEGRWGDAEERNKEALDIRIMIFGADHLDTLMSMSNLASTYWGQGRLDEAERLEVQVLEAHKMKLGADHPNTLMSINNLASTYWDQGRLDEAERLEVQVLEAHKMKLGADHPDTLRIMSNLASTYQGQGRLDEAERLKVQVLEAHKIKLGADHPNTLRIMNNLATTYQGQGRLDEAERLKVQVLEAHKMKLRADHPDTLRSMNNLASTYQGQGRLDEAERLQVQVLEAHKMKLGADHPDMLRSMHNLASTYQGQGRLDEAERLQVQVLEAHKMKLRADHPDTLRSMNNLASIYQGQGRLDEAERLKVQVLEAHKIKLGADHPDTLISMNNLASIYWDQGRLDEAERLEVQVLEAYKMKLGADHPDTLRSMNNLAYTLHAMRRTADAIDLMRTCAQGLQAKLGPDHRDTKDSTATLAEWESQNPE